LVGLALQLNLRPAQSQGANTLCAEIGNGNTIFVISASGSIYKRDILQPGGPWTLVRTVPITATPRAIQVVDTAPGVYRYYVFTEDGGVFECDESGGCVASNVFTGPVNSRSSTWGDLKARYR